MPGSEKKATNTRSSPRSTVPLEVDIEISGDTQRVLLISKDIGAGGVFLRTKNPCDLWKKVKLSLISPNGDSIEVSGEVVRRVTLEQANETRHPPGIAVAFDEVSRAKRKKLISLVLDLCSLRQSESKIIHERTQSVAEDDSTAKTTMESQRSNGTSAEPHPEKKADELLDTMDKILDSQHANEAQGSEIFPEIKVTPKKDDTESDYQSLRNFIKEYKAGLAGDNYYNLLGIKPVADIEQITSAYRNLMSRLKPPAPLDQLPRDLVKELSSVLGKIRKAYSILSIQDRRRAYDFLIDNGP